MWDPGIKLKKSGCLVAIAFTHPSLSPAQLCFLRQGFTLAQAGLELMAVFLYEEYRYEPPPLQLEPSLYRALFLFPFALIAVSVQKG